MEKPYEYSFEKLEAWQDARMFVTKIYEITSHFPDKEKFGLCSQIQRASVSVVSNIAEGLSRNSAKEKIRFIEIAYGSLMEVYCQLVIAKDLHYISNDIFIESKADVNKISNKLNGLNRSIKNRSNLKTK